MSIVSIVPDVGVIPKEELLRRANGVPNDIDAGSMILFTDAITEVTIETTAAELIAAKATFSGYADKALVGTDANEPIYDGPGGGFLVYLNLKQFNHSGGAVANTIAGYAILGDGGNLICAAMFEEPMPVASAVDSIPVVAALRFK